MVCPETRRGPGQFQDFSLATELRLILNAPGFKIVELLTTIYPIVEAHTSF